MDVVLPKILSYRYMYFNSHNGDGQTMGCISPELSFLFLSIMAFNVRYPLRSELYFVFRLVYRSAEHALLVVSFRLSKLAANIYLDL